MKRTSEPETARRVEKILERAGALRRVEADASNDVAPQPHADLATRRRNEARQASAPRSTPAVRKKQDALFARRVAKAFGERLKQVRRERGWKQDAFAAALGVSRTTASNIERGSQRIFLDQLLRAATILGVSVDSLVPPTHLGFDGAVLHTAADAPLTRVAARSVARTVQDVLRSLPKHS